MAGIEKSTLSPCQTLLTELPFYEVGDQLLGTRLPRHNSSLLPSTDAQLHDSTDSLGMGRGALVELCWLQACQGVTKL